MVGIGKAPKRIGVQLKAAAVEADGHGGLGGITPSALSPLLPGVATNVVRGYGWKRGHRLRKHLPLRVYQQPHQKHQHKQQHHHQRRQQQEQKEELQHQQYQSFCALVTSKCRCGLWLMCICV